MFRLLTLMLSLVLANACQQTSEDDRTASAKASQVSGHYQIDPITGDVRAEQEDAHGITTTMRAGKAVEATLPAPFIAYPDARTAHVTHVDRGDDKAVMMNFTSNDSLAEIAGFYRTQARQAGVDVDVDMAAPEAVVLAGANGSGVSFALTLTREDIWTRGQLWIAEGLD